MYALQIYEVPHEVKNQCAIAKRTSQIMKWEDVKYANGKWF